MADAPAFRAEERGRRVRPLLAVPVVVSFLTPDHIIVRGALADKPSFEGSSFEGPENPRDHWVVGDGPVRNTAHRRDDRDTRYSRKHDIRAL